MYLYTSRFGGTWPFQLRFVMGLSKAKGKAKSHDMCKLICAPRTRWWSQPAWFVAKMLVNGW